MDFRTILLPYRDSCYDMNHYETATPFCDSCVVIHHVVVEEMGRWFVRTEASRTRWGDSLYNIPSPNPLKSFQFLKRKRR